MGNIISIHHKIGLNCFNYPKIKSCKIFHKCLFHQEKNGGIKSTNETCSKKLWHLAHSTLQWLHLINLLFLFELFNINKLLKSCGTFHYIHSTWGRHDLFHFHIPLKMPHSTLGFPLQWNWHIPFKNEMNVRWNRVRSIIVKVELGCD